MAEDRSSLRPSASQPASGNSPSPSTSSAAGAKHSPGPWSHSGPPHPRDPRVWVYAPDTNGNSPRIAVVEAVVWDGDAGAINLANARLIVMAPDLLEMAKWAEAALAPFSVEPAERSGIARLRDTIRRAEGRS